MSNIKKQTFLQGAIIIAAAHIIVKVIGALFKIPLSRFVLGPDGMGIYNASYTIYNALFIISTAGLPVAISKMVSESLAKGREYESRKIFNIAMWLLVTVGVVGGGLLFFGAGIFADSMDFPSAKLAIAAMAPGLFFVSVMSAFRGYFQGHSNMIPTAISEVVEASGKLFIGLGLGLFFLGMGKSFAAAGAILGVSTGTFLGALFLLIYYLVRKKDLPGNKKDALGVSMSGKQILSKLLNLAIPITLGASVFTLASVIDLTMIIKRLAALGFELQQRETLYGYYSAHAVTMFNMPPTLIASLSISIVPAVASAYILGNKMQAKKTVETAMRITVLFALPCAVGMSVLSGPILHVVFGDTGADLLLKILAYGVIFVSIVMVSNAIIQSLGKVWIPVANMLVGGALKVVINYYLVGNIDINITGAPIGTVVCYLVTAVLNIIALHRLIAPKYGFSNIVIKPVISAALMGLTAFYAYAFLLKSVGSITMSLMAAILAAGMAYFGALLLMGGIKKQDILFMPMGKKIVARLESLKLLR